jgi:hypothetical protein
MTLNIVIATPRFIVCAADRRLTSPEGKIITELSCKLTYFECKDARGCITYNGIGWDHEKLTPNDWVADEHASITGSTLDEVGTHLALIANTKIAGLPDYFSDRRHSFLIGAYWRDVIPVIHLVSNYETLRDESVSDNARPEFEIEKCAATRLDGRGAVVTGTTNVLRKSTTKRVMAKIDNMTRPRRAEAITVKVIRDASYSTNRLGTIGTSVNSAILQPAQPVESRFHVVGGTKIQQHINFLTPKLVIRDPVMGKGLLPIDKAERMTTGKGKPVAEHKCFACSNPVPEGFRKCGVCGAPMPQQ